MQCDKEGCSTLLKHGFAGSWKGRWLTLSLHFRHQFTHAAATDASLQYDEHGKKGVSIGIWSGVQPDWRDEEPRTLGRRVGDGLWGMAVPANWEIADAEMYAILRFLRLVAEASDEDAGVPVRERRVLVMSDCKPAMQQIEDAWRRGETCVAATAGTDAMLEKICTHRKRLGCVIIVYTPGHQGISPNEYADAAAKAHVWGKVDPFITTEIAQRIKSRPCIYHECNVGRGMCTRTTYESARISAGT